MSAAGQKPTDFTKYNVKNDLESVERAKQALVSYGLNPDLIHLDGIRNDTVLTPLIKRLQLIKKDTGFVLPNLHAVDIIDGDPLCIASYKPLEGRFFISQRFSIAKKLSKIR